MRFLNRVDTRIVELSHIEISNIEMACKNVDPLATGYTVIYHLIEAFARMPKPLARRLYQDVTEMSGSFGFLIQKTAEEKRISFDDAEHYLTTGVMPKEN